MEHFKCQKNRLLELLLFQIGKWDRLSSIEILFRWTSRYRIESDELQLIVNSDQLLTSALHFLVHRLTRYCCAFCELLESLFFFTKRLKMKIEIIRLEKCLNLYYAISKLWSPKCQIFKNENLLMSNVKNIQIWMSNALNWTFLVVRSLYLTVIWKNWGRVFNI